MSTSTLVILISMIPAAAVLLVAGFCAVQDYLRELRARIPN